MEEVWKVTLSSLQPQEDPHITSFHSMNLQEFLARSFSHYPPTTNLPNRYTSPPPLPATFLSLNAGPEFNFEPQSQALRIPISNVRAFNVPYADTLAFPSGLLGSGGKKRFEDSNERSGCGDQRHKRLIKNRESAARSRDRKQAYTLELEKEVATLTEENVRLKKQQRGVATRVALCTAAGAQLPKKNTLQRTLTAPF